MNPLEFKYFSSLRTSLRDPNRGHMGKGTCRGDAGIISSSLERWMRDQQKQKMNEMNLKNKHTDRLGSYHQDWESNKPKTRVIYYSMSNDINGSVAARTSTTADPPQSSLPKQPTSHWTNSPYMHSESQSYS